MRLNKIECEDPDCQNEIAGTHWNDIVWTAKDLGWEPYQPYEVGEQDDNYWWCPPHKRDKKFSFPVWHWTCSECHDDGQELSEEEAQKAAAWHRKEDCIYRDSVVNVLGHDAWLAVKAQRELQHKQWKEREDARRLKEAEERTRQEQERERELVLIELGKRYERLWWVRLIRALKRGNT